VGVEAMRGRSRSWWPPAELPARLADLLRDGPPQVPVQLSGAGLS